MGKRDRAHYDEFQVPFLDPWADLHTDFSFYSDSRKESLFKVPKYPSDMLSLHSDLADFLGHGYSRHFNSAHRDIATDDEHMSSADEHELTDSEDDVVCLGEKRKNSATGSDVECIDEEDTHRDGELWVPGLRLTYKDKKEIINGDMLSDKHIYAAQALLQLHFPHVKGFQDSCLGQMEFKPVGRGGLQIHHTRGNHWVLSSSMQAGLVRLYDSIYSTIDSDLERQLCEIYSDLADHETGSLPVDLAPCQKQRGSKDCALFAIAWAYELCRGNDISDKVFSQTEMREHLVKCFEHGEITSFPSKTCCNRFQKKLPSNVTVVDVEKPEAMRQTVL